MNYTYSSVINRNALEIPSSLHESVDLSIANDVTVTVTKFLSVIGKINGMHFLL